MRNYLLLLLFAVSLSLSAQQSSSNLVTEQLSDFITQNPEENLIRINISLKEKLVARNVIPRYATLDQSIRRDAVVSAFKEASSKSQANLMNYLNTQPDQFNLIHTFWITNIVTGLASPEMIENLSKRDDISRIDIDAISYVLIGEEDEYSSGETPLAGEDEITYNVTKMNVPDVWNLGYTGEGIIVAVLDTGVNYDHVDLEDHMWEDPDYPYHGWDFANNDNNPKDDHGHGSHCAGTVAGDGSGNSQTGMAPDATIMALKVLNSSGGGNQSSVWEAIEFAIEHDADVLSMSIGWTPSSNPNREAFRNAHDNALAAGIVASVAAGNEAGSPNSTTDVRTPGDCPPPWLHPEQTLTGGISSVVCIGATDQNDNLASFSSRGPCQWEFISPFNDYPFNPEMGLLRPDVSAPGVNIKSASHTNNNGYTQMSGTSMATPGVAGVMALMLSKNPDLTPADISEILEMTSVDLGADGKDNLYGTGRVDAYAAILETPFPGGIEYSSHTFTDTNENGEIEAGESIQLSIEMSNSSPQVYSDVNITISSASPYIVLTDDTEPYGVFAGNSSKTIENGFAFDVLDGTPGNMVIPFSVLAQSDINGWESDFTITTFGPNMKIDKLTIDDSDSGNGDGILDPGEMANLILEVSNDGQTGIANVEVSLELSDESITVQNPSQMIDDFSSGETLTLNYLVEVSTEAQAGTFVDFNFAMESGSFLSNRIYNLGISLFIEDWETNNFKKFNWVKSGSPVFSKWETTAINPYEGMYAAKTGGMADNDYLSLKLSAEVIADDNISFYYSVSSEENKDFLRFYIDDEMKGEWSGEQAWAEASYEVTAGNHTFKWEYIKDGEKSNGADAAFVDYIVLPQLAMPTADAGMDASICDSETYTLDGSTVNSSAVLWSTSGDGAFSDVSILNPVYTPGAEDLANADVRLTLTAEGYNGFVSSSMNLVIKTAPDKTDTPAGETEFCQNPGSSSYTVNFIPESTYTWEIEPATAGTTTSTSETAVIDWNEDFTGIATVKVRSLNSCGESDFSEPLEVTFTAYPEVSLGDDQTICGLGEFELDAGNPGSEYLWSTGATTQTILASGEGETNFWVKVTNLSACASSDTVVLNFAATPVVNLGADTTICKVSEFTLDAGNAGSAYLWSTGETTQTIVVKGEDYAEGLQEFICTVTNTDGCESLGSIVVEMLDCTGIDEVPSVNLEVYPNPNRGIFTLDLGSSKKQTVAIRVMNVTGVVVYDTEQILDGKSSLKIDLQNQADGVYSVFVSGENILLNKKIVVRR